MMPQNKPNDSMQKGERRQKLHEKQDNKGNDKVDKGYRSFENEKIK